MSDAVIKDKKYREPGPFFRERKAHLLHPVQPHENPGQQRRLELKHGVVTVRVIGGRPNARSVSREKFERRLVEVNHDASRT